MLTFYADPHTSEWITMSRFRLRLRSLGNGSRCCFPTLVLGSKFRQPKNSILRLHFTKPREVDMDKPLLTYINVRLDLFPFHKHRGSNFISVEDEHPPFRRPCTMTLPSSSMKHLRCINRTCIPWSTIFSNDTRLFVIVGMCNTFMSFPFCPTWMRETSPTCSIVCRVSSPVSTTRDCSGFSKYENHSS